MWGPEFDKYNEFGKWWKMEFESLDGYDTEFKLNPVYEQFTPRKCFPYLLTEAATGDPVRIWRKNKNVRVTKNYKPYSPVEV